MSNPGNEAVSGVDEKYFMRFRRDQKPPFSNMSGVARKELRNLL